MLVAFGNPMVDVTVSVDAAFWQREGLQAGSESRRGAAAHRGIFERATAAREATYACGGSATNTARAFAWCLQQAGVAKGAPAAAILGAVGDDVAGTNFRRCCDSAGVLPLLQEVEGSATGSCLVLVGEDAGRDRCLLAVPGAYKLFDPRPVEAAVAGEASALGDILQGCRLIYATSFTLTNENRAAATQALAAFAGRQEAVSFALNLSSAALFQDETVLERMRPILASTAYLFGNAQEFRAFAAMEARESQDERDESDAVSGVAKMLPNDARIVVTRGAEETTVYTTLADGSIVSTLLVPVPRLERPVVNTNGAGDAFVGAFLAGVATGRNEEDACVAGHTAAAKVLCQVGAALDGP
eukprot:scaffold1901_cov236-Pinguiococcus_pyrenoidosus.AAC.5